MASASTTTASQSAHQEFFALAAYQEGDTPWDIAAAQPAIVTALAKLAHRQPVGTRQVVTEASATPFDGLTALDLGCGYGYHARLLAEHGFRAVGVDVSRAAVASARGRTCEEERSGMAGGARSHVPEFVQCDLLDSTAVAAALGGRRFDLLLDAATFHCFDDEERAAYMRTLQEVSHCGSRMLFLNFSDAEPGVDGCLPRRLTEREVRASFGDRHGWAIQSLEPGLYLHGYVATDGSVSTSSSRARPNAWLAVVKRAEETPTHT